MQHGFREQLDPRPGGVDQDAGGCDVAPAAHVEHQPPGLAALGADAARAGADHRAALGGIERIEHDQTRVVRPAIGIFEAASGRPLERRAERIIGEIEGAGRGQNLSPAEMVVDEQPQAQHPGRAHPRLGRQHEAHRPDEVRRHAQHHLALDQRLAHQPEPSLLEIAQAPVDELGGGRRRAGREIVLLDQQNAQAPAGGVAGDPGAVDAAADDGEIEVGHHGHLLNSFWRSVARP